MNIQNIHTNYINAVAVSCCQLFAPSYHHYHQFLKQAYKSMFRHLLVIDL